ncbi:nuclease [Vibrio vulnificus]|uniref:AAA domain-containing protein n=1 Tax=Vibrio aestuarianus TaxID=28171 RepID=A0A9X4FC07_9VIBR|nr:MULTISPECIES: AAA domain-containing protein [Vibrio]MDE1347929.1 AAA domain-containing protein [Vibrio aestuarianus]RZP72452.1 nuclease [Vibrio vulnificus]
MDIKYWDGGLENHEVQAIEKIKKAFSKNTQSHGNRPKRSTGFDGLKVLKDSPMHNWRGYAGFRFTDSNGKEGEFDLLIFTHCNILVVELKDWNKYKVESRGANWFHGKADMGASPVDITRRKKQLIERKIKSLKNKIKSRPYLPHVHHLVVMTGNSDFSGINPTDKEHTLSLAQFMLLSDEKQYNDRFRPHSGSKTLLEDIELFESKLFGAQSTAPKPFSIDGWQSKELIFDQHPLKLYKEYTASSESNKNEEALIRRWDFSKLSSVASKTPNGRFNIVSREREVLQYIKLQKLDLYNHCLSSLTIPQKDKITANYNEVYELPPAHKRFNEFVAKYGVNFSDADRIALVKLLVAKFADLHELKIAHRDLGDHSVWISPSKQVALSNFISAYHQPIGTVGPEREELSVNEGKAPEGMPVSKSTTPFNMDVYSLAVLSWHILTGIRLSPASIKTMPKQLGETSGWYRDVLTKALDGESYDYASDFFTGLVESEPNSSKALQFDLAELEPYRHEFSHSRKYREDSELIVETSSKEVYVSGGRFVKAWLNVNPIDMNAGFGQKIHHFLEKVEKLQALAPSFIPKIIDFGIANNSSALFLVSEQIDGNTWDKLDVSEDQKWDLISQLVNAVEHFHGLGFSHGDIHPGNLMVSLCGKQLKLFLIDTPDFCFDSEEPKNNKYSPENIDYCSAFERDIFATMRLSCELLGVTWGSDTSEYPAISKAINVELEDDEFGFKDLSRFKTALENPSSESDFDLDMKTISLKGTFPPIVLYPDNGQLFVHIGANPQNSSQAKVKVTGVGGSVEFFYSKSENCLVTGRTPRTNNGVGKKIRDDASLDLPFALKIEPGYVQLSELDNALKENEAFQRAITQYFEEQKDTLPQKSNCETGEFAQLFEAALADAGKMNIPDRSDEETDKLEISTRKLWQAIIDTETESHPYIKVNGDVFIPNKLKDQLVVPYDGEKDALDSFTKKDEIEALIVNGDDETKIGEVDIKASAMGEVRLTKLRAKAFHLTDGDIVFFRSSADRKSYEKRKNALERLLNKDAVIENLADYFEPECLKEPVNFDIEVTDDDFSRYDREDDHGNKISLNSKQREAFQKLISYGPLSMLQGPPGTGKTEFIAAFVHYLIEKQDVHNILLVSQSHEAVNTAAERIRRHCRNLGTELEAVRFSNRESAVSDGLKDVYSHSIINSKRELFKAEAKHRVKVLAQPLGLDENYLERLTEVEISILGLIRKIIHVRNQIDNKDRDQAEKDNLRKQGRQLSEVLSERIADIGICIPQMPKNLSELEFMISNSLDDLYAVKPDEARKARALIKISKDMIDVLNTERVNYDEFLARSRQLVTGTCVGIGQRHMGIANNQYDWVIIDEAARSIASELAIAMQSGKRVLLVGDHQQLPPLYTDPHKKALARKLGIAAKGRDIDDLIASDFARAFESFYGQQTGAQLLTQYRMAPAIGTMVSKCFYDGKLENGDRTIPNIYQSSPKETRSYVTWLDTSNNGKGANHNSDKGVSIYNRTEADAIIKLLTEISKNTEFISRLDEQVKDGEAAIGVICMYGEQKRIIRQKFKQVSWADEFKRLVKIDTVDSYQGKENRVIILSVTRSIEDQSPGFLKSPNRINVALSRAMDRLVIVGDTRMWRGKNERLPLGKVLSFIEKQKDVNHYQILLTQGRKSRSTKRGHHNGK